ncbi:MAG TPA: DNA cytosine methyltransferase, partial [Thermoanaerobaculia bacterium]|nr:DNA cytosine methyltransferase [Thermoanaerobaculia bacterium]
MSSPTVISLFSGAGGIDFGFEAAKFRTAVALDLDHDSCETLRRNRRWPVIESDIFGVTPEQILDRAGLGRGEADVLIAGPPCQPFSKAGYWARGESGRLRDPRAATLDGFLRVLEAALPRAFLLENVHGIAYSSKDEGIAFLLREIAAINRRTGSNYQPVSAVLNAAWFGVPQMRERFFMIASRDGTPFRFPDARFRPRESEDRQLISLPTYRTAWDALADVRDSGGEDLGLKGKWADLLPSIPEGSNYIWHTERGGGLRLFGWRRRYWSFLLKLAKALPSWTIQAQPGPAIGPFHWENRRLSMRELCRLQTFPDDVVITGTQSAIQRQVGNAVPSLLAEILAREIRTQLLGRRPLQTPIELLPPDRSPAPPPERVRPVPAKYRSLVAEHAAHPGTGKGPRGREGREALEI